MSRPIRPDHVAIYIRWSTEDQGEGTTLAVQSEACRHYLASQGWQVRDDLIYIDDGYSGGSLDRPALTRLRQAIQTGEVDCVVVFKLDRLSRSVIDTVTLVLREWDERTHLKSAREPVDTTTAVGKQFFYMLVSYAEWERSVIRERMFSGKLRRAREGRSPGLPTPYGYRKGPTPGAMTVADEEAAIVRLVFSLAAQGLSLRQIGLELNRRAVPGPRGGRWGVSTLSKLLRNPLYAGRLVWGRHRANPRHGKAAGEPRLRRAAPHADVPATAIPPLVTPEAFAAAQAALAAHRRLAPAAGASPHLLTGLLVCARCGRPMQFNRAGDRAYYRCSGRPAGCEAQAVPARPLEATVVRLLCQRYGATVLAEARARAGAIRRAERDRLAATAQSLAAALARLHATARRVDQDYLAGRLSATERRDLIQRLEGERHGLTERQSAVDAQRAQLVALRPDLHHFDPWTALPSSDRKAIVRLLTARLAAARGDAETLTVEIRWRDGLTRRPVALPAPG